ELLDTGVLQTNINTKLEALEEGYAPKLTEVTAQLAHTAGELSSKASVSYVDMKTQAANLAWKESYRTLEDLQAAYPEGDTFNHVVLDDGMIYTWLNEAWENTQVQANGTGIADKTITPEKTTFLEPYIAQEPPNLFDKADIIIGVLLDTSDGVTLTQDSQFNTSNFIKVEPNSIIYKNKMGSVVMYDSNKSRVTSFGFSHGAREYEVPHNVEWVRVSLL